MPHAFWMFISLASISLANHLASPPVASQLRARMQLVYTAAERAQDPWAVDSVTMGLVLMPGADCATVSIRRSPTAPSMPTSRLCVRGDTLFGRDAQTSEWIPQRPVGPRMTIRFQRPNRDSVIYTTSDLAEDVVSGLRIPVVLTTVLTTDSLGVPKRRLTERYAVTLTTATEGRFEVPEGTATKGATTWKPEQEFRLTSITGT